MSISRHLSSPPPLLPRAFRKRLSMWMLVDISLALHVHLDALLKGDAAILPDFGRGVLTWRNVADRLSLGQDEMNPHVDLFERLVAQLQVDGALTLSEQDRETAREGVDVMNLLAQEVDLPTAGWCAERATAEIERRFGR